MNTRNIQYQSALLSTAVMFFAAPVFTQGPPPELFQKANQEFERRLQLIETFHRSVEQERQKDYEKALAELKTYEKSGGSAYLTAMRTGWLLSLQGNFSGAAEAYDRASRLESQCVNSRLGFLNMQIALGDAKQTLQAAQKLLQLNPADLAALKITVADPYSQKDYRTAGTKLIPLIGKYPMDVDALAYQASVQLALGNRQEAIASASRFATLYPAYATSGEIGAQLEQSLGADLKNGEPLRKLWADSVTTESSGDAEKALSLVTEYAHQGGDRYFASMRAAWLNRSLGRNDKSLEFYRSAAAINRGAVDPKVGVLAMEAALANAEGISAAQRDLLTVLPVDYLTMLAVGDSSFAKKDYRKASALFEKLHRLYPMDVTTLSYLSWSEYYSARKKDSVEYFTQLLSLSPGHEDAEKGLSYSLDRPYPDFPPRP